MTRILFILHVTIFLASCKKEDVLLNTPVADFNFFNSTADSITLPVYHYYPLNNISTNANEYLWHFGNDSSSKEKDVRLYYTQTGTYTVTLTAINKSGRKATVTKKVKVVEPVVNELVVTHLSWNAGLNSTRPPIWPVFTNANVWVEIRKWESGQNYPVIADGVFDSPIIYTSNIATNVNSSSAPIVFEVPQNFVIDLLTLKKLPPFSGMVGYSFNFFVQDATSTYLLYSSNWSGGGFSMRGVFPDFVIGTGNGFVGMTLNGTYQ